MKRVILLRHAKSNHDVFSGKDFDRALTTRGILDAQKMAGWLRLQNLLPDLIYTSPARRALDTAKIFRQELDIKQENFLLQEKLYKPAVNNFYKIIEDTKEDFQSVIVVAHNPGITEFANDLGCNEDVFMSTCSLFGFQSEAEQWIDFRTAKCSFLFFHEP